MSSVQAKGRGKRNRDRDPIAKDASTETSVAPNAAPGTVLATETLMVTGPAATASGSTQALTKASGPAPSAPTAPNTNAATTTSSTATPNSSTRPSRKGNRPNIKLFASALIEGQGAFKGRIESAPVELAEQLIDEAVNNSHL